MAIEAMLPGVVEPSDGSLRWFRPLGCVQRRDDGVCEVYVGGVLIGAYEGPAERNVLLVKLSEEPRTRVVELAAAFDVSTGGDEGARRPTPRRTLPLRAASQTHRLSQARRRYARRRRRPDVRRDFGRRRRTRFRRTVRG